MPELAKARLIELDEKLENAQPGGKSVAVQFNPESLKVSYANSVAAKAEGGKETGDQAAGPGGRQFVGSGSTKLSLTLWFDASTPGSDGSHVDDVRRLTQEVTYFITAKPYKGDNKKLLPPGLRFEWGSFQFDGLVDSLEESLEYFSRDGHPLRASIALNMSQQKILYKQFDDGGRIPGMSAPAGTQPMGIARAGANLPAMVAGLGKANLDWQRVASANGIENPRQLTAGMVLNLNPPRLR
jgi:hypothetical protein